MAAAQNEKHTEALKLPLEMLYQWESQAPERIYMRQPIAGKWDLYTWKRVANETRCIAAHLRSMNLPPNSHIAILSKNCAQWIIADLAISMSGHVSVPLYPNLLADTVAEILEHSESKLVFVGKLDSKDEITKGIPSSLARISFPFDDFHGCTRWNDILSTTAPIQENIARNPSEMATIIYTSGTTGEPKGVMHSFTAFAFAATRVLETLAQQGVSITHQDRFFSYLPLAHVAERMLVETFSLYCGGEIWFAESLDTFAKNLRESSPTVFLGVPRIWKKFQSGVFEKLPEEKLDRLIAIPLVGNLIRRKIRKALGLNTVRIAMTGAAPTPYTLFKWYERIGITLHEAYAMSENCGYSHFSLPNRIKFGWVGQPWPNVNTKISENGELLVHSPCSMLGYFKNPEETKAVLEGGFVHTGDMGEIDEEGFFRITGRRGDLFKTSKGKFVAPAPIEMSLSKCPLVEQVCVVGSGFPQPFALLHLPDAYFDKERDKARKTITDLLEKTNAHLDPHERLIKLVIVKGPWTVDNNLLTPTLKVKRREIERRYGSKFESWHEQPHQVVWES